MKTEESSFKKAIATERCGKCGKELTGLPRGFSLFSDAILCEDCKKAEMTDPRYEEVRTAILSKAKAELVKKPKRRYNRKKK